MIQAKILASNFGYFGIVKLLIKNRADINCRITDTYLNGYTPLMLGLICKQQSIHTIITIIILFKPVKRED
jgi:hypothetical protein